ncbi:MAG: SIMPL domain-containing protein [Gammaproteobacteria bacterium]|nr:SIMPL domain-containing protein [Gammaproteobacteria bacterium]
MKKILAVLLFLQCQSIALASTDEQRYNLIHLQAERTEKVSNDTMHVTLNTYGEDRDASRLATQINADMAWALQQTGMYKSVKAKTGSYQTWPVERDKILTKGWRGQQTLELESTDIELLSKLAGTLQEKLKINSMRFSVSDEQREAAENRLVEKALDAFKERARIVRVNLKASGYRIVDINIGTSTQHPPIRYQSRMAAADMAESSVAVEGGESDIRVTVSGHIELAVPVTSNPVSSAVPDSLP